MSELLPQSVPGKLFVLSAPAGTGKTTLAGMLCAEFASVKESISCTTRAPRSGEKEGEHYHFLSEEQFLERLQAGAFLEHAEVFGKRYGTLQESIEQQMRAGYHSLLVIDTQGALQVKGRMEAVFIFLSPPSLEALQERLTGRKSETEESIRRRLAWAKEEMTKIPQYDYHIVNDNLQVAYQALRSILIAETHRVGEKS